MRQALRLLARANTLTPFVPTGLTGVLTHPSPRPHLIQLYKQTLTALSALPQNSVYRQSTEALTNHRLKVVSAQIPAGYEEWKAKIAGEIKSVPGASLEAIIDGSKWADEAAAMDRYGTRDDREFEWDGQGVEERSEGPKAADDPSVSTTAKEFGQGISRETLAQSTYHPSDEPALSPDQIGEIENAIGAGLIEEVIMVAKRELALVRTMQENAVWEELVEKPVEGQWTYFERPKQV